MAPSSATIAAWSASIGSPHSSQVRSVASTGSRYAAAQLAIPCDNQHLVSVCASMAAEVPMSRAAPWLWAALSVMAWIASFFAAFGIVAGAGTFGPGAPDVSGMRIELAALLGLHGILAAAGVLAAGRLAFGRWPTVDRRATAVALIGLSLAMAVELALHEWTEARFGYYDWEMVGWTAGLSLAVVALAVATFGAIVAPRSGALPPLLAQVVATTLVGLIVLSNVGGIPGGVEPKSWPLAIFVGLSAAYAAAAVVIGARRVSAG